MAVSTIPAFTAALKAALAARPALANVPVTDGLPAPGTFDGKEWIAILDVEWEQTQAALGSASPRDERYTVKVAVSVMQSSRSDQTTSAERAFDLFAELEQLIRADPDFSGYGGPGEILNVDLGDGSLRKRGDGQGREAWLETDVRVWARI